MREVIDTSAAKSSLIKWYMEPLVAPFSVVFVPRVFLVRDLFRCVRWTAGLSNAAVNLVSLRLPLQYPPPSVKQLLPPLSSVL